MKKCFKRNLIKQNTLQHFQVYVFLQIFFQKKKIFKDLCAKYYQKNKKGYKKDLRKISISTQKRKRETTTKIST